jgi:hypothetical protein
VGGNKVIAALERTILETWNGETEPIEHVLEAVAEATKSVFDSGVYMGQLDQYEFSEAILHGYDDVTGFAFFYLVRYFIDINIIQDILDKQKKRRLI